MIIYAKMHRCACDSDSQIMKGRIINMKTLNCIALTITIIGAINWGLIGFFNFNLVAFIFGEATLFSRIIYALVGLCGLYLTTFYWMIYQKETA